MFVAHCFALGSVSVDFRPVQADIAQVEPACCLRQQQDLDKQLPNFGQKGLPKIGNGIVVGVQSARNIAKGDRLIGGLFNLPRTEHPSGIAIEQQAQQNFRRVRLAATSLIANVDAIQVKLGNHVHDKAGQVVGRQAFPHANGEIKGCFVINGDKSSGYKRHSWRNLLVLSIMTISSELGT